MPDPRQQDHRLNKDELVTYRYSVVLVEEQSFKFYLFTSVSLGWLAKSEELIAASQTVDK